MQGAGQTWAQTPPSSGLANYIVVFRDWIPNADVEVGSIERTYGLRAQHRFSAALKGFAVALTPIQVRVLERLPWVDFVSPDYEVSVAESEPLAGGDVAPPGIRRIEAATTTEVREESSVGVAVIDTGIALGHPDLNAVHGIDCTAPGTSAEDDYGHGTHVAGTIGARNNGNGVVGVVPGTTVHAVKVLNAQGTGSWSDVICGLDWVTANAASLNIKVANMSISGGGSNDNNCGFSNNDALHRAICRTRDAGVTIVAAAGNSNANFASAVPAAYPEVLTVTAMSDTDGLGGGEGSNPSCRGGEADDRYASFSSYAVASGDANHTIAGPGTCVLSTYVTFQSSGSWWNRRTITNHTYATISGTSMATPHVAGSVALCYGDGGSSGPCAGLSPAQVIQHMRSEAQARSSAGGYGFVGDPTEPLSGRYYGYLVSNDAPAAVSDFEVAASPASRTVSAGSGTNYTVTLTSLNGFDNEVALSVSGLPTGATGTFSPNGVTPTAGGATSTLNISTTGATPGGSHTVTITGTGGGQMHEATVTLEVVVPDFGISASPASRSITPGAGTSYTVTLAALNGFNSGVTLSTSGLPTGATATFTPSSVTPTAGGATSTLSITTTGATPGGSHELTITGVGGGQTHATTVTLAVVVPDFSIGASPASRTVTPGAGANYTVTLAALNGFSSGVSLSVSGLPSGATPLFTPTSVTPAAGGTNSTLSISTTGATPTGSYPLTITGTSGSLVHTASVTLVVEPEAQGDFSISSSPSSRTLLRFFGMNSTTYTVTLTGQGGYNAPVTLSVSGLATGMTANFTTNPVTPSGGGANSTMQLAVNSSTPRGSRTLTITGVGSDGTTHSVNVSVYVY